MGIDDADTAGGVCAEISRRSQNFEALLAIPEQESSVWQ